MTGVASTGYDLKIGFVEVAVNNMSSVASKGSGLFYHFLYEVNSKSTFVCAHTGADGGGAFIQMQNPFSQAAPPSNVHQSMRKISDNNSTFTIFFDGGSYVFYHNSRLVHRQGPPRTAPTAPMSLMIFVGGNNMPVKLTNFVFGNAPTATDIDAFAKTLPQTGGRRNRRRNNRGSRRGGFKNTRRVRRGTRRTA